jgi:hypothetical protein
MTLRGRLVLALAWVASLVVVATLASGQAYSFDPLPAPMMLSGSDVGYRVEGWRGGVPAGRLMVRINGTWLEAEPAPMPGGLRPVR